MISLLFFYLYFSLAQRSNNATFFSSKNEQDSITEKFDSISDQSNHEPSERVSQSKYLLKDDVPDLQKYVKCPFYQLTNQFGTWEVSTENRLITTNEADAKIQFSFNGTGYIIVCHKNENYGKIDIYYNGVKMDTIDLASNSPINADVFKEIGLPFGEHTIEVRHTPGDTGFVNIKFICYDPTYNTARLSILPSSIVDDVDYNKQTDNDGYSLISPKSSNTKAVTFSFYGTRFWVTGSHKKEIGAITVKIDGQVVPNYQRPNFNQYFPSDEVERGVLLYYSDILETAKYTIEISLDSTNVELCTLFYSQQPYNAVILSCFDFMFHSENTPYWSTDLINGATTEGVNLASFQMYGTHFWLIGDSDTNYPTVDLCETPKGGTRKCGVKSFSAKTDGYVKNNLLAELKIPLSDKYYFFRHDILNSTKFHFLNCFYLNEEIMEPPRNRFISFSHLSNINSNYWEVYKDADGHAQCIKSKTQNELSIKFVGTKFWLEGSLDPSYGQISISLDGTESYPFSLYREKHVDQAIYYQSSDLTYKNHTVILKSAGIKPITFSRLYYEVSQPQNVPADTNGLIRVPVSKIEKSTNTSWGNAPNEIYSNDTGVTASYSFEGTKVYIISNCNDANGLMEVYLDEKLVRIVDLYSSENSVDNRVYFSPDLPFGKHTIKVRNPGGKSNKFISICCFLYRPGLFYPAHCIDAYNAVKDGWEQNEDQTLGTTTTKPYTFQFYGTRFWLTGNANNATFETKIDGQSIPSDATGAGDKSALLSDSGYLQLDTHNVEIKYNSNNSNNQLQIKNLIYIQQPKNATIIFAQDMIKSDRWILSTGDGFELYSISVKNDQFETSYYANQHWIFAKKAEKGGRFTINDNGQNDGKCISAANPNGEDCSTWSDQNNNNDFFLIDSRTFNSEYHHLKIIHTDNNDNKYIQIYYLYYFNTISKQPTETEQVILPLSFKYDNKWQLIEKDNTKVISTSQFGATSNIQFGGSHFWLEGYLGPAGGLAFVYINDAFNGNISLYREEPGFSIFYESPNLENNYYTIKIESYSGDVSLSKLYYTPLPPTAHFSMSTYFSGSIEFSNSISFTSSAGFSKSELFSESNDFSKSELFTESNDFSQSEFFSRSDDFTLSESFAKSSDFSKSVVFSKSNDFSQSELFSGTNGFSFTESFTRSFDFTKSEFFSNSNAFSGSKPFSRSVKFTKSESFSETSVFSLSTQFSESEDFTMSIPVTHVFSKSLPFTDKINEEPINPDTQNKAGTKKYTGIIIGAICGILVLLIAILIVIILLIKRKKEQRYQDDDSDIELTGINMTQSLEVASENFYNSEVVDIFDARFGDEDVE